MPIVLYDHPGSPPCCSVRLVAAAIGIELNLKLIELREKEQLKPEYLKINPLHTIPAIDDNGFILWESRAICTYLIDQYAENHSLYPKDPKQRAIINRRLFFDMGTLYKAFREYLYPTIFGVPLISEKLETCYEALKYLDQFLEGQNYVAGNQMTIADLVMASNFASFTAMVPDMSRYKNIPTWFQRIKTEAPKWNEIMDECVKVFKSFFDPVYEK